MKNWRWTAGVLLAVGILCSARGVRGAEESVLSEIRAAHARVADLVCVVERKEVQEGELKRSEKNTNTVLEFSRLKLYFKAPDRLRFEGKRGLVPVTLIQNGPTQVIRLSLGIKKTRDMSDEIRNKRSGLDFGLLSGQVWQDFNVVVAGHEAWENRPAVVLRLSARGDRPGSSFQKVWVDSETLRVVCRERFKGSGQLKDRQVFRQPLRLPGGAWLSRRIEIANQAGRFVGALELGQFEVNQGLADSMFRP
jgi:outer membrane lipoprotein-sorting protein